MSLLKNNFTKAIWTSYRYGNFNTISANKLFKDRFQPNVDLEYYDHGYGCCINVRAKKAEPEKGQ